MKKIKKLVLKKEVIDRLGDDQMNRLLGRGLFCPGTGSCTDPKTCCAPPDTYIYDCPYLSAIEGCDGYTCGWAPGCNG
jgi:natural product precursor